ncbi:MAG: helix-turn-helix transcriptional regulator [Oscillospiraceae bacterium]|nr:helix-turn-helix transcriptional regulator [Oscillospiraceae bacterium]
MEPVLLVCKALHRDTFDNEVFTGQDDILAVVEKGSFVFDNGSGEQQVGPGEAVNFKKNITYHRHILQPADLYLFRYRAEVDLFGSGKVLFRDHERIRSTLALLHICDSAVQLDTFACQRALFADIVNQYRLENAAVLEENSQKDPVVSEAIAYIHSHLHEKINLAQLSSRCFLSYVQFSRRFKQATGTTPQNYIAGLRLKKAQLLLSDTDLSIKQIARDCGFGSEYYFSNFFRSHCLLSPSRYRAMIQAAED